MAVLLALLFLSSLLIHARADCQSSTCSEGGVSVRFPFGLQNHQSFMSCAYNPLFTLKCSNSSTSSQDSPVVFNLPSSGDFFVRNINYLKQEIQLYDPLNCLPKRFLKLDLSFSPFGVLNYTNYTFLRCPKHAVKASFSVIDCLSNSTVSVLATSSMSVVKAMNMCETYAADLPVPVSRSGQSEDWFSSDLTQDFRLRWSAPDCRSCEARGGSCAFAPFADYTIQDIGCTFNNTPPTGNSSKKTGTRIFWIIVLCVLLTGVTVMTCMGCLKIVGVYITKQLSRRRYYRANFMGRTRAVHNPEMTTAPTPRTTNSMANQTPHNTTRPVQNSCGICQEDYQPEQRPWLVDGCQHSFHAHCFARWLETCPICRNSALFSPEMLIPMTAQATPRNSSRHIFTTDFGLYLPWGLPSQGQNSCGICQEDYQLEQRVELVVGCQHSFHAQCLEEWLLNSRCPVCWNSPTRTTLTPHSTSSRSTNSVAMTTAEHNPDTPLPTLYTTKVFEDSEWLPRPGENSCVICRDKYRPEERLGLVNGCHHSFHAHCLESWLQTSPTCPLCRNSLSLSS